MEIRRSPSQNSLRIIETLVTESTIQRSPFCKRYTYPYYMDMLLQKQGVEAPRISRQSACEGGSVSPTHQLSLSSPPPQEYTTCIHLC